MSIPFTEDIALLLLAELAGKGELSFMSLHQVAQKHGLSFLFLKKIARSLRHAGLIVSREGIRGGYALLKDPQVISLWDVYRALVSDPLATSPMPSADICPINSRCMPQVIRRTLATSLEKTLRGVTLQFILGRVSL